MRKSILLALAIALLLTGCATQQAGYASGYAGGYYLGDCVYPDICGPGIYGTYFYYTPLFPTGPLSPERLKVDLTASHRVPRVVGPYGGFHDSGHSGSGYGSSVSEGSMMIDRSAPAPAPAPPPVHAVAPRS